MDEDGIGIVGDTFQIAGVGWDENSDAWVFCCGKFIDGKTRLVTTYLVTTVIDCDKASDMQGKNGPFALSICTARSPARVHCQCLPSSFHITASIHFLPLVSELQELSRWKVRCCDD